MVLDVEMVLADPKGSIVAHYVRTGEVIEPTGSWQVEGIGEVEVKLVWDPPWTPELMSEDAKLALGVE